jgi:hypothetical protein
MNKGYEYAIFAKWEDGEWFNLSGGWYISPKKAVASYKAKAYSRDFNEYHAIKIVEREMIITDRDLPIRDLSKYGIHFTKKKNNDSTN